MPGNEIGRQRAYLEGCCGTGQTERWDGRELRQRWSELQIVNLTVGVSMTVTDETRPSCPHGTVPGSEKPADISVLLVILLGLPVN